jgi:excisionase family DNA binding protein
MNIENIIRFEELPLTLKVADVAKILGISLNSAYELFHNKDFPSRRIGKRRWVVSKSAFIKWMDNPKKLKEIA